MYRPFLQSARIFSLLVLCLIFWVGCSSESGKDGTNGLNTLVTVTTEPIGNNCPNGGTRIASGTDKNRNGTLEEAEILSTQFICHDPLSIHYLKSRGFIRIIPGGFTMGDQAEDVITDSLIAARPAHFVTLTKSYYIADHEVTLAEYQLYKSSASGEDSCKTPNCPVIGVSWSEIQDYLSWRNLVDAPGDDYAYRLCTEAEWEFAARAGSSTKWSCGDDVACLSEIGWYINNSTKVAHPVKKLKPNSWGLYDMHGNVKEMVQDAYQTFSSDAVEDPLITKNADTSKDAASISRVWRGGTYTDDADAVRSAVRGEVSTGLKILGFRLCASIPETDNDTTTE